MTDMGPLLLLWMLASGRDGRQPSAAPSPPQWPTTRSPPPRLPAFVPQVPQPPEPQHGTPLTTLHNPPPAPAPRIKPPRRGTPLDAAAKGAKALAKQAVTAKKVLQHARSFNMRDPFANLMPSSRGEVQISKPVISLQMTVNARGGALKEDGLYGPKTAAAWSALARRQGLPADISRVGPKVASVVLRTYEVLSVPPIP